jgi:uncharacterized protein (DUF1501 family)
MKKLGQSPRAYLISYKFVSMGGFDSHDELGDEHPALLAQMAGALAAFYQSTVELGVAE